MRRALLRRDGMTLLDLLTTMTIMSVLASVTLGTVLQTKKYGGRVACLRNLRELYLSFVLYTDDNKGVLPRLIGGTWVDQMAAGGQIDDTNEHLLVCPTDPTPLFRHGYLVSYAGNCWMSKKSLAGLNRPGSRMLIGDMGDDIHGLSVHCARCGENFGEEGFRHGGKKANFLFPDGHAESVKKKQLNDKLWADDTTFPNNCE